VGTTLRGCVRRVPDGEPGGRRLWTSWQYPVLRANPFLVADASLSAGSSSGALPLRIANGVRPDEVRFGELGYAREARASYLDFVAAQKDGSLPADVRFQVALPTPYAVIRINCPRPDFVAIEAAYERAMTQEVERIARAVPHRDLCIQWDVCIEMIEWDGQFVRFPSFPGIEAEFGSRFSRYAKAVPADVELGFHLCYGDWEGKHFVEPKDATKMVELANLIASTVERPIAYIHMPVPVNRDDDAFFAPLRSLKLKPQTELYLGLVHAKGGVEGTLRRMSVARKYVNDFGIASECGIARARNPELVKEILATSAAAAKV
jgi:methionine synthase II (cobalamin-independent)